MKKYKIMFWVSTSLIFITQGVMEVISYLNGAATPGIVSLGYPEYFVGMLVFTKVIGSIALIAPMAPKTLKEWAYAGFTFDFIAAMLSMYFVMGMTGFVLIPLIAIAILAMSYYSYHKLN
jgi:DoxX-like family